VEKGRSRGERAERVGEGRKWRGADERRASVPLLTNGREEARCFSLLLRRSKEGLGKRETTTTTVPSRERCGRGGVRPIYALFEPSYRTSKSKPENVKKKEAEHAAPPKEPKKVPERL